MRSLTIITIIALLGLTGCINCIFPTTYSQTIPLAEQANIIAVFDIVGTASEEMTQERATGGWWNHTVTEKELDTNYGYMEIGGRDNVAEYHAVVKTKEDGRILSIKVSETAVYCTATDPKPAADIFIMKIKEKLRAKNLLALDIND